MAMGGGSSRGIKNDINVTPLIDVVLVLLIIFMVVTPMLQRGKDVSLPEAESVEGKDGEGDPLVVSVTADKRVWIESTAVLDGHLGEQLGAVLRDKNTRVMLKGDERLTFGDVRRVMNDMRAAGAKNVAIGVEEKKKK